MYTYLVAHPMVGPSLRKEVHYFDVNSGRSINWYRSHFPMRISNQLGIDASPYYMQHPLVLDRVRETLPHPKLIVLLRNPVDRAYSHYEKNVQEGKETLSFREALAQEDNRIEGELEKMTRDPSYNSFAFRQLTYRRKGIYESQLRPWMEAFSPSNLLILKSEDLYAETETVHRQVLEFLELPFYALPSYPAFNSFSRGSGLDETLRAELLEFYRPHNERLYDLLGRDFGWE
jgi:hypothetical protein